MNVSKDLDEMTDFNYYNDELRCYRDGVVERFWRKKGWTIVENTANHNDGYNSIGINKKMIRRHRIIAYCFLGLDDIVGNHKGIDLIDHIDGDKLNNCVDNLRITNQSVNCQNRKNVKGYTFIKKANKYQAYIMVNGKNQYLKCYDNKEDAKNARLKGEEKYHTFSTKL